MSQSQTVEEIMQRIRAQVKKQEHPAQPETTAPASSGQSESVAEIIERIRGKAQAGTGAAGITASDNASEQATAASQVSMKAAAPRPPFRFKLHELSQLRVETATALQGSRDTGQLNPRNPGPINALIQFIKKIMRRSLTWYTRPIHVFQAGVIRALQQVLAILDDHRDHLQRIADELNEHAEAIERNRAWTSARLESQATAQEQSLQQVAQRMDTAFASTNAALASHDSALNDLARKIPSELSERNAQQIDALKSELQGQRQEMQSLLTQMRQATAQQRTRERDMRRLVHAVEQGTLPQSSPAPQVAPMFPSQIKGDYEFDYFVFEDQYRGDEADIRGRQAAYLEYFRARQRHTRPRG
jgi:hypothetical protein